MRCGPPIADDYVFYNSIGKCDSEPKSYWENLAMTLFSSDNTQNGVETDFFPGFRCISWHR